MLVTIDRDAIRDVREMAETIKSNADRLRAMGAAEARIEAKDAAGIEEMRLALGRLEHATICLLGQLNRLETAR